MNRLWTWVHAALWMAGMAVAAGRLTLPTGVAGAALGALLGVLAGDRVARTRLRTWAIPLAALGAAGLALLLASALSRWPGPARLLGPRSIYAAADFLPALALPLALVGTLEALARRHHAWRLGGLAVVAALYGSLFAAHREGFLNRPYFLVDPLWGNGLDPLPWFLFLGLGLTVLLAVVLVGHELSRRTLAGLAVLVVALFAAYFALPQRHLKQIVELHRVQGEGTPDGGGGGGSKSGKGTKDGGQGKPDKPDSGLPEDFHDLPDSSGDGPLAVVVFHNDYTPPMGFYYFRETAFSAYNGARLVQDAGQRFDRDLPVLGAPPLKGLQGTEVRTTVALMAIHGRPFGLVDPVTLRETGNPDPKRFFQAFDVRSLACPVHPKDMLQAPLGDAAWGDAEWRHFTEGPADPRYGELAAQIIAQLPAQYRDLPFAKAVAIKLWLDRNTTYSLSTAHGESPDPVADFLFGDRRGHCVYLAHAACLLYRAAGVPSRVAAGYAANPEFRFGGANLMLRASNAHAWPEVKLRDGGWLPLDISPAKSEAPPQEAPDKDLQQMLGEMAMSEKPPPPPPPELGEAPVRERLEQLARLLGWALLAAALLALPAALAVKLWRRWAPRFCGPADVPRLAYRAALDAASAHGLVRARGETREAFAARAAERSPAFQELTALHLRWALGPRGAAPPAARCRELLGEALADFRAASSPSRRMLSFLNPLAWARVH